MGNLNGKQLANGHIETRDTFRRLTGMHTYKVCRMALPVNCPIE